MITFDCLWLILKIALTFWLIWAYLLWFIVMIFRYLLVKWIWSIFWSLRDIVFLSIPRSVLTLNISDRWRCEFGWLGRFCWIFLISFLWFQVSIYLIDSSFILDILFSINGCWPFMVWYDFLSMESQGCLVIFVAIYLASLCAELTWKILFLFIFTRSSNTESIYGKSVCAELTWKILFSYISRGDRTQSIYMASPWALSWPEDLFPYISRGDQT